MLVGRRDFDTALVRPPRGFIHPGLEPELVGTPADGSHEARALGDQVRGIVGPDLGGAQLLEQESGGAAVVAGSVQLITPLPAGLRRTAGGGDGEQGDESERDQAPFGLLRANRIPRPSHVSKACR